MAALLVQLLRFGPTRRSRDFGRERLLVSLGEAAVAPLAEELRAAVPEVRSWAAGMLSQIASPKAVEALRPLTGAPETEIRLAVGKALAAVKDASALDVLCPIAADVQGVQWMRNEALLALGAMQEPGALLVLLRCFEENNRGIQMTALVALQRLGAPAVPALIELCESVGPERRASVLRCLEQIGERRAVGFAIGMLNDPDPNVRAAAVACVARFRAQDASAILEGRLEDPDGGVRRAVCEALGTLGDRDSAPLLLQRLKEDKNSWVRTTAASALGRCGGADDSIPLLHLLLSEEEDASLLEALLSAIAELGDERILELLELFEPRRLRKLSRKDRIRLQRKVAYAAGRIRARLRGVDG